MSVDAIRQPLTGVGRYNLELARQLALMPDLDLIFLQDAKLLAQIPTVAPGHAVTPALRDLLSGFSVLTDLYRGIRGYARARALGREQNAILHGTNYYLPTFSGPSVVTIHDVSVFSLPQHHSRDRVRYMQREVALSLERAARVITVSEFSKTEIVRVLGYPADRIHVTPLGTSDRFRPHTAAELAPVLDALGGLTPGGYCLYVGTLEPRKNLITLLHAFERLPLSQRRQTRLVLAGYQGWGSDALRARIDAATREGWLICLDYVADDVLPSLVAGALLFVYPSTYEGFGLPVLEAMACGVPVVCSTIAALDEVAGDAAAFTTQLDVDAFAETLAMAMEDATWRNSARAKGLARAADFSWQRCASLTRAVYQELVRS